MQADDSKEQASEPEEIAAAKPAEASPTEVATDLAAAQSPLIVLVDDDAELGQKMRSHFEEKGMRVQTFVSRIDVLEWSWSERPVLLVVDQNLSGEDGRSLALDLRDQGKLGDCPMVLVTDSEMDLHFKEFTHKLGFRKIVAKPFGFDVLERVIADEPRARTEAVKTEVADKQANQKAFEERKAAVLKRMGLDEGAAGGEGAEEMAARLGSQATKKVQMTTSVVTKGKTATVGARPGARAEAELPGTTLHWCTGLLLGFLFPAMLVAIRAFLYSAGYTTPAVIVEGAVLGLLAGLGLSIGIRRMAALPGLGPVTIGVFVLTLAVWGLSLFLRTARGIEFVEYSPAALAHLNDPGRSWGMSEWMSVAYNLAGGFLTFAGALYVIRAVFLALERAELTGKRG